MNREKGILEGWRIQLQTSLFRRLALNVISLQNKTTLLIKVLYFKNQYRHRLLHLCFLPEQQSSSLILLQITFLHIFRVQAGLFKLSRWTATWWVVEHRQSFNLMAQWWERSIPARCHMWVEFVAGSRLAPRVFLWVLRGFPPFTKANFSKFQFDQDRGPASVKADVVCFLNIENYCNLYFKVFCILILFSNLGWLHVTFRPDSSE